MAEIDKGLYARALQFIKEKYLPLQKMKTFTSDDLYRFAGVDRDPNKAAAVEKKRALGQVLYNITHDNKVPDLEQTGKVYRLINRDMKEIVWWESKEHEIMLIRWPYGVYDNSEFEFETNITLNPGDAIGLAGEGNQSKTAFGLNIIVNNMDKYECVLFTSEFNDIKFRNRMGNYDWTGLYNPDGKPKFRVVKLEENFQDIVVKDAINVFDWIRMDDEPWKIAAIIDNCKKKVGKGLFIYSLQKRSYKTFGVGGEASKDYADVYFTLSYDKTLQSSVLKVEKVKCPGIKNPNYKSYAFNCSDGAHFRDIREI